MHTELKKPKPGKLCRVSQGGLFASIAISWLLCVPANAQLQLETPSEAETPETKWQSPDLLNLRLDWWSEFDTISPDVAQKRFDQFLADIKARIPGLDPENMVEAQNLYNNLESVIDLHLMARRADAASELKPVLTLDSYNLDDVMLLQSQWRDIQKERAWLELQRKQTERQVNLLEEQRTGLFGQYSSTAAESPRRILLGLSRVVMRVEYAVARQQVENIGERLAAANKQAEEIDRQRRYARENLEAGDFDPDKLDREITDARGRISSASQQVAAVQRQLLEVLSAETLKPSLELLRKQQLTRASAQADLSRLTAALLEHEAAWYRLRTGRADKVYAHQFRPEDTPALIEETLKQVDFWSATSQSTLVTVFPEGSLNAQKNLEIARSVAREVMSLVEQIRDLSDDLLLVQDILATELVRSRSGAAKAWARLKLITTSFWTQLTDIIEFKLFSIGEAPVTLGGLFKALLILLLAYAVSRFIRHLLDHATGRQQFAKSPAIYTLGRLLHYVIIIIGVFAALGSIGMDFTNFALIAGALSVGIGFGLQAIVNNFVSGLILLFEGSLRIGDYIELDSGLAGVVTEINTRATVVNSNDGVDVVVPNSELVTTKLTNWTLRENVGRLRIPFGVAYGTDKDKVKEAALEAATEMEFVLLHDRGREPQVRLVNFGDSALEFELLAWVSRPGIRRPHRVRSSFLWALETQLAKAGIEIPFPQRDLHIRSDSSARTVSAGEAKLQPENADG